MRFTISFKVQCEAEDKKGAIAAVVKAHNIKAQDIYHVGQHKPKFENESMEAEIRVFGGARVYQGTASKNPKHRDFINANWHYQRQDITIWNAYLDIMQKLGSADTLKHLVAEVWQVNDKNGVPSDSVWVKSLEAKHAVAIEKKSRLREDVASVSEGSV